MKELFSIIPGMEKAAPVPVLEASSLPEKVFIREWVSKNRACLVRGAVRHWPAVHKFKDRAYWTSIANNVEVAVYPHMNFNDRSRMKMIGGKAMPFPEAIEWLFQRRSDIVSMPSQKVTPGNRYSALIKEMPGFSFLPFPGMPRMYDRMRFFLYRGAATAWHYHDVDETLMCQVCGSKRVGLLPPGIPKASYVSNFLHSEEHLRGEVLNKDLDLRPMIVDVEEGDALYIPPYWHHAVVPNDDEVGFTLAFCWRSPMHILGNFSLYFVRKLYKEGMWPIKKISSILPFIGVYAGCLYTLKKAMGKA